MKLWQSFNEVLVSGAINIDITFTVNVPTLIIGVNLYTYVDTAATPVKRVIPCEVTLSSNGTVNKKINDSVAYGGGFELDTTRLLFTEGMNFQPVNLLLLPGVPFAINTEAFVNVTPGDVARQVLSIQYEELPMEVDISK